MNIFVISSKSFDLNNINDIFIFDLIDNLKKYKHNIFLITKEYSWTKNKLYNLTEKYFNNIFFYDNIENLVSDIENNFEKIVYINYNINYNFSNQIILEEYNFYKNNLNSKNYISSPDSICNNYNIKFKFPYNQKKININNNYLGEPLILCDNIEHINIYLENIDNNVNIICNNNTDNIINKEKYNIKLLDITKLKDILVNVPFVITDKIYYVNLMNNYNILSILFNPNNNFEDFDYLYKYDNVDFFKYNYNDLYTNREICEFYGKNNIIDYKCDLNNFNNYINNLNNL